MFPQFDSLTARYLRPSSKPGPAALFREELARSPAAKAEKKGRAESAVRQDVERELAEAMVTAGAYSRMG